MTNIDTQTEFSERARELGIKSLSVENLTAALEDGSDAKVDLLIESNLSEISNIYFDKKTKTFTYNCPISECGSSHYVKLAGVLNSLEAARGMIANLAKGFLKATEDTHLGYLLEWVETDLELIRYLIERDYLVDGVNPKEEEKADG